MVRAIAYHLPERVVSNADLQAENPDWDMSRVEAKVGIAARRVAGEGESASDLGFAAASRLLDGAGVDRASIDYLLFCTQSPDYALPTTACILQDRLGLSTSCGAIDFNQGCSGYVYGLHLAKAMIAGGMARNVLLVTAETYSRYIHPRDRSVRVLFGDGASATLVTAGGEGARIGEFVLGTDGAGHRNLIVPAGGSRRPADAAALEETTDDNGNVRSAANLFMDGQELFSFTLERVPQMVKDLLQRSGRTPDEVGWYVFHQANAFMNDHLRRKLGIPRERAPLCMSECGNTVSSTIPIALHGSAERFGTGDPVMLVGFGVGYSWGACLLDWGPVALV